VRNFVSKYDVFHGKFLLAGNAERDRVPVPANAASEYLLHQGVFQLGLVRILLSAMVNAPARIHHALLHPAARRLPDDVHLSVPHVLAHIVQRSRPGLRCYVAQR